MPEDAIPPENQQLVLRHSNDMGQILVDTSEQRSILIQSNTCATMSIATMSYTTMSLTTMSIVTIVAQIVLKLTLESIKCPII